MPENERVIRTGQLPAERGLLAAMEPRRDNDNEGSSRPRRVPDPAVEQLLAEFSAVLAGMDRETLEVFRARWARLASNGPASETILEVIDGQIALRELLRPDA